MARPGSYVCALTLVLGVSALARADDEDSGDETVTPPPPTAAPEPAPRRAPAPRPTPWPVLVDSTSAWVALPAPEVPYDGVDPALVAGLVLIGASAGIISAGVADLQHTDRPSCPGCPRDVNEDKLATGNAAVGAGGALALVAIPAVLTGTLDSAPGTRISNGRMTAGIVLTALGAAALTSGWVWLTGKHTPTASAVLIPASGSLLGVGIPLWASGARQRARLPPLRPRRRDDAGRSRPQPEASMRLGAGPGSVSLGLAF